MENIASHTDTHSLASVKQNMKTELSSSDPSPHYM